MCGRLRLPNDWSDIKIRLRLDDIAAPNLKPSWSIAHPEDDRVWPERHGLLSPLAGRGTVRGRSQGLG
jgi:hypothetical protein